MRKSIAIASIVAASLIGLGSGVALANGSNGITVCYANQQLVTGGGTMSGPNGSGDYELYHPDFHTTGGTDGHGMLVINQGSNQGAC